MKHYILACAVLGIVSLLLFLLGNLALVDIARGEPDLANEWRAVKVGVIPIVLFHVTAIIGLFKAGNRIER